MRWLHCGAEDIGWIHRSAHGDLSVNQRGPHGYGAIVAAEALIAVVTEKRLLSTVRFGGAGVGRIGLRGQFLVPQAHVQCGVRRVAVRTGPWSCCGNWRFARQSEAVHAQHVPCHLTRQSHSREKNCQRSQYRSNVQFTPPLVGDFSAVY